MNTERIKTIAINAIGAMFCGDFDPDGDESIVEQIAEYLGTTPEELLELGLIYEDDLDESEE